MARSTRRSLADYNRQGPRDRNPSGARRRIRQRPHAAARGRCGSRRLVNSLARYAGSIRAVVPLAHIIHSKLALAPGTRLGVFELIEQIGRGGMGEVYRARDTKLNRDVALKVLPDSFASDADRLARFTREAQTLASLNHPNIAHIHGLENPEVCVRS